MQVVMTAIEDEIIHGEKELFLENGETLLILMRQHNIKEEGILYPMEDQHLAGQADALRGVFSRRFRHGGGKLNVLQNSSIPGLVSPFQSAGGSGPYPYAQRPAPCSWAFGSGSPARHVPDLSLCGHRFGTEPPHPAGCGFVDAFLGLAVSQSAPCCFVSAAHGFRSSKLNHERFADALHDPS